MLPRCVSAAPSIQAQSAVASALPPDQRRAFAGAVVASVAAPAAAGSGLGAVGEREREQAAGRRAEVCAPVS